jgi:hypothetical protein
MPIFICTNPPIEKNAENTRLMHALTRNRLAQRTSLGSFVVNWPAIKEVVEISGVGANGMDILQKWLADYERGITREKYWQEKAGRMAQIAAWMYNHVDERSLGSNEVDMAHDMEKEILEILPFEEAE